MSALDGTVAVVTGASSGIGEATARALADEGATVALLARRRDRLERIVADIGERALAYEVDLSDADAARAVIDRVAAGAGRIDILVNNAGYGVSGPAREADFAEWQTMIDVNLTGVLATTHAALPHLTAIVAGSRGVADVVTVSSVVGRKIAGSGSNVYSATKHAVGAFCEALRQEMAEHHVRVGLIEPGVVVTEMTTRGGNNMPDATSATPFTALRPADVAAAIVWMVTRPRHAAVNEILVRPIEQVV